MKRMIYRENVEFKVFKLYKEANNSDGCEYGYPIEENLSTSDYEEANAYVCPRCIKKYGLHEETETTKEEIDELIKHQEGCEYNIPCGVDGCSNEYTLEALFDIAKCRLENI